MHTWLSDDDVAHYREHGYLVIDTSLDAEELEEWCGAVDEAIAARPDQRVPHRREGVEAVPAERREWFEYYANVSTQRLFLRKTNERVKRLVFDHQMAWTEGEQARYQQGDRLDHDHQIPLVYDRSESKAGVAR